MLKIRCGICNAFNGIDLEEITYERVKELLTECLSCKSLLRYHAKIANLPAGIKKQIEYQKKQAR